MKLALLACILTLVGAIPIPEDTVFTVELDNHKHVQNGVPGKAVRGFYHFIAADGRVHEITYVADDQGYRVIGDIEIDYDPSSSGLVESSYAVATPMGYPPATTPSSAYLPPEADSFFSVFDN